MHLFHDALVSFAERRVISMFINFSNHPSRAWGKTQLNAAMEYGEVIDIPFPAVNPYSNEEEIYKICE